jgi:hypothetical protein
MLLKICLEFLFINKNIYWTFTICKVLGQILCEMPIVYASLHDI